MTRPATSSIALDGQRIPEPTPRGSTAWYRLFLATSIALVIVAFSLLNGPAESARAEDQDRSQPNADDAGQASYRAFLLEIRRTLKHDDDRLVALARSVLETADDPDHSPEEPIAALELKVKAAEARYQAARLDREIAESRLEEYQKATLPREMADAESNIATFKEERETARKAVPIAEDRLARIQALLNDDSPRSIQLKDAYTAAVAIAKLREKKAALSLESAESQKKTLLEFTKIVRTKELESETNMTTSSELAMQAIWDLEKVKLDKTKRLLKRPVLAGIQKRILSLVDHAYPIREAIREKLARLVDGGKADESLQAQLSELTNQLDSLVTRADGERIAARIDGMKFRIQQDARPSTSRRKPGR